MAPSMAAAVVGFGYCRCMHSEELKVRDAHVFTPKQHHDSRGTFLEWFTARSLAEHTGQTFDLAQANYSVSSKGVLRGIHYADVPPGQAKYVTCVAGAVLDVVVDLRVGSPTFGQWDSVLLDTTDRRAIYIPKGLGHAFVALHDASTVVYFCSTAFNPAAEHEVNPLDPEIAIAWPTDIELVLSDKDRQAPTLAQALELGMLPTYPTT